MKFLLVGIGINVTGAAINAATWFAGLSGVTALFCSGVNIGCAIMLSVVVVVEVTE